MIIGEIIGAVTGIITEPLKEWQKRKTMEKEEESREKDRQHEINLKKLEIGTKLAEQGIQAEISWDARAQDNMKVSWKDEYLLVLFSIPLIGAFIPQYQDAILKGFEVLDKTPEWYILSILGMVAGAWGLRWLISRSKRVKGAS
jgi:hypothetical protein